MHTIHFGCSQDLFLLRPLDGPRDHQKLGPVLIEEKIGPVNYRLRLPESMKRIYPTFHVSLLEEAQRTTQTMEDFELDEEEVNYSDEYEAEEILDVKRTRGKPYYLIKWRGYTDEENTWEPVTHLTNCRELVHRFVKDKCQAEPARESV